MQAGSDEEESESGEYEIREYVKPEMEEGESDADSVPAFLKHPACWR